MQNAGACTVHDRLRAAANVPGHLVTLDRRPILGPAEGPLWPSLDALAWHHRTLFLRR